MQDTPGGKLIFGCGDGSHWAQKAHDTFVREEAPSDECCCSRDKLMAVKLQIMSALGVPKAFCEGVLGEYPSQERTNRISNEILEPIANAFGEEFLGQVAMYFCGTD